MGERDSFTWFSWAAFMRAVEGGLCSSGGVIEGGVVGRGETVFYPV